jgi:AraC family transcriptional regulator
MNAAVLHSVATASGSRIRMLRYPPADYHVRHRHAASTITLVLGGSLIERVGDEVERASALSMVVKPAGTEHEDSFGPHGAITLQIVLSARDESLARRGAGLGPWRWAHVDDGTASMLCLLRQACGSPPGRDLDRALHDVVARIDPPVPVAGAPAWLSRARVSLGASPEPIRDLARRAGVHRVHLARAFRRHFGCSPGEHRRRARVRRAAELLLYDDLPLAEVALVAGFSDQAHLCRELRSAAGITPLELRKLGAGVADALDADVASVQSSRIATR